MSRLWNLRAINCENACVLSLRKPAQPVTDDRLIYEQEFARNPDYSRESACGARLRLRQWPSPIGRLVRHS